MASGKMSGLTRFLLWDFARASWQYDLMVALILAFIFLTPRHIFRDQPKASNIVQLPMEQGGTVFWVDPGMLNALPEPQRAPKVEQMLRARYGKREAVVRLEPIFGNEQEITGYMAWTRP
jgi:hypothetical protein